MVYWAAEESDSVMLGCFVEEEGERWESRLAKKEGYEYPFGEAFDDLSDGMVCGGNLSGYVVSHGPPYF